MENLFSILDRIIHLFRSRYFLIVLFLRYQNLALDVLHVVLLRVLLSLRTFQYKNANISKYKNKVKVKINQSLLQNKMTLH